MARRGLGLFLALTVCCGLVLNHCTARAQFPPFGGSEVLFSTEDPPSDVGDGEGDSLAPEDTTASNNEPLDPVTQASDVNQPEDNQPTIAPRTGNEEPVDTTTAAYLVTEPADAISPSTGTKKAKTEAMDIPTVARPPVGTPKPIANFDPATDLPQKEDCAGVTCDADVLRKCSAPILFKGQCCPVCSDDRQSGPCVGARCPRGERCAAHGERAVCCSDLSSGASRAVGLHPLAVQRHLSRPRHYTGSGVDDQPHFDLHFLLARYQLPNNCSMRFRPPQSHNLGLDPCRVCSGRQVCETRRILRFRSSVYSYETLHHFCCLIYRPSCPLFTQPKLLGRCHFSGHPRPKTSGDCECTVYRQLSQARRARDMFRHSDIGRRGSTHTTLRFVTGPGDRLEVEFCQCSRHGNANSSGANSKWMPLYRRGGGCTRV